MGGVALHGKPHRMENYSAGLNKWFDVVAYRPMARQFAVLVSDITERKKSEEKLHLAASVFAHSREGIMITAPDGCIIDVNDAFTNITGYPRDEIVGQNPRILSSGRQSKAFYTSLWRDLRTKGHWYGEVWNRRKSGDVYAEMQTITTVFDANGQAEHYVSLFSDVTAAKEHEKKLQHIAHYDALTNLPNRVLLADRLNQGMTQALRHGKKLALAFLDLDAFKAVNDSHGHEVGDALLIALSGRMRNALREGDTLARIGGDEFVVVLGDLADTSASLPLLNRLLSAAAQPVQIGDVELQLSASLGVTFFPQPEEVEADQLLRQADQAMYQAKIAGKNRYHVFDAEQDRSVRGQYESIERIRLALSANEFVLHYQPKVNMRSGKCIGAEALIRWQHPDKGLLAPAVFLPVMEDHPLAIEVGEWVIDTALTQMTLWRSAGLELPVSVNIGARQLQQASFTERLGTLLAAHPDIDPSSLELEVLETSALEDIASVSQVIHACRDMGVKFALDDFGTGYSSLTYLKRLPVTMLKIDQSFVRDMLDDPDDLAILQGVIGLASAFRRDVIAEGVETVAHGALLLRLGCELAQGYGIARPMPADSMPAWTAAWHPDAAWKNQTVISKEDLPLLFASADLRAWLASVIGFLKGDHVAAPIMDEHKCQIGQWIDAEGLLRYQGHPAYTAIAAVHQEMHVRVEEVMRLHDAKRPTEDCWPALLALRDSVLEQLEVLIQESEWGR
ncbi:MAG: EAL domain-containing protein [Rhodoferax sp.]|nr:EAL domain-containing protein [Rhodoferax sp.]MBP7492245.1 EAL domain-containing protein [Rhodoferax sp.]